MLHLHRVCVCVCVCVCARVCVCMHVFVEEILDSLSTFSTVSYTIYSYATSSSHNAEYIHLPDQTSDKYEQTVPFG